MENRRTCTKQIKLHHFNETRPNPSNDSDAFVFQPVDGVIDSLNNASKHWRQDSAPTQGGRVTETRCGTRSEGVWCSLVPVIPNGGTVLIHVLFFIIKKKKTKESIILNRKASAAWGPRSLGAPGVLGPQESCLSWCPLSYSDPQVTHTSVDLFLYSCTATLCQWPSEWSVPLELLHHPQPPVPPVSPHQQKQKKTFSSSEKIMACLK